MARSLAHLPIGLAERARPVSLAGEQLLAVHPALGRLLPAEGLVRGTTIAVSGLTSLAVALVVEAAAAGSWVAAVGLAGLGLAAVEALGLPLHRLVLVAQPEAEQWAAVVATLAEGFDVVLVGPPPLRRSRPAEARRLVARVRERRSLLVQVGWPDVAWPEEPELTVSAGALQWEGVGQGWGHCRARRAEVSVRGRRGADRPRSGWLWLPGPDGRLAEVSPEEVAASRPQLNLVPGRRAASGGGRGRAGARVARGEGP